MRRPAAAPTTAMPKTLRFSDIVDSTPWAQRVGDAEAARVWAEHDRRARQARLPRGGTRNLHPARRPPRRGLRPRRPGHPQPAHGTRRRIAPALRGGAGRVPRGGRPALRRHRAGQPGQPADRPGAHRRGRAAPAGRAGHHGRAAQRLPRRRDARRPGDSGAAAGPPGRRAPIPGPAPSARKPGGLPSRAIPRPPVPDLPQGRGRHRGPRSIDGPHASA